MDAAGVGAGGIGIGATGAEGTGIEATRLGGVGAGATGAGWAGAGGTGMEAASAGADGTGIDVGAWAERAGAGATEARGPGSFEPAGAGLRSLRAPLMPRRLLSSASRSRTVEWLGSSCKIILQTAIALTRKPALMYLAAARSSASTALVF